MIKIKGIRKQFGEKVVLDDLNLHLKKDRVIGFVGANGSGKTTLMKIMLGLMKANSGQVWIKGEEVTFGETRSNRFIGYLPDMPEFYPYYRAEEYLELTAAISKGRIGQKRIKEVLNLVGLSDIETQVSHYSRGMKQRLGFAQSILHEPEVLICDEPTSALDPEGRQQILELIKAHKQDKTIFFSTHILSDIEQIADEVVFLKDGKIKFHKSLADLKINLKEDYLLKVSKAQETEAILIENACRYRRKASNEFVIYETNQALNLRILNQLTSKGIFIEKFIKLEQSLYDLIKEGSE